MRCCSICIASVFFFFFFVFIWDVTSFFIYSNMESFLELIVKIKQMSEMTPPFSHNSSGSRASSI